MKQCRDCQICSISTSAERQCPGIRCTMGPSTTIIKRNSNGNGLGRIAEVKIEGFRSASDCISLVWPRNFSKHRASKFSKIECICEATHRSEDEHPKLQSLEWKEEQLPRVEKKTACVERNVGECFQWKANEQCSKGDSWSFTMIRYLSCEDPSCNYVHLPVWQNHKSKAGCIHGKKCRLRHVDAEVQPNKKSKKVQEYLQLGCVFPDAYPKSPGAHGTILKIRERKGPSRGIIQKREPREVTRSLCNKKDASPKPRGTWRKTFTSSKYADKATFYSPIEARVMLAPNTRSPEERDFAIDSGASMHMLRIKDSSSEELETVRRSRTPTVVVAANCEAQTNQEAP